MALDLIRVQPRFDGESRLEANAAVFFGRTIVELRCTSTSCEEAKYVRQSSRRKITTRFGQPSEWRLSFHLACVFSVAAIVSVARPSPMTAPTHSNRTLDGASKKKDWADRLDAYTKENLSPSNLLSFAATEVLANPLQTFAVNLAKDFLFGNSGPTVVQLSTESINEIAERVGEEIDARRKQELRDLLETARGRLQDYIDAPRGEEGKRHLDEVITRLNELTVFLSDCKTSTESGQNEWKDLQYGPSFQTAVALELFALQEARRRYGDPEKQLRVTRRVFRQHIPNVHCLISSWWKWFDRRYSDGVLSKNFLSRHDIHHWVVRGRIGTRGLPREARVWDGKFRTTIMYLFDGERRDYGRTHELPDHLYEDGSTEQIHIYMQKRLESDLETSTTEFYEQLKQSRSAFQRETIRPLYDFIRELREQIMSAQDNAESVALYDNRTGRIKFVSNPVQESQAFSAPSTIEAGFDGVVSGDFIGGPRDDLVFFRRTVPGRIRIVETKQGHRIFARPSLELDGTLTDLAAGNMGGGTEYDDIAVLDNKKSEVRLYRSDNWQTGPGELFYAHSLGKNVE